MPEKHVYEYSLIRLVPRVEREEFLNVGLILYCKRKKHLQVRYHIDVAKIRALSPEIDIEEVKAYLHTWELISQGSPEGGTIAQLDIPSRFRWLTAVRSTVIQSGKVHPGICGEPEAVFDDLFEKLVL